MLDVIGAFTDIMNLYNVGNSEYERDCFPYKVGSFEESLKNLITSTLTPIFF
jgi:hypothetical protein